MAIQTYQSTRNRVSIMLRIPHCNYKFCKTNYSCCQLVPRWNPGYTINKKSFARKKYHWEVHQFYANDKKFKNSPARLT